MIITKAPAKNAPAPALNVPVVVSFAAIHYCSDYSNLQASIVTYRNRFARCHVPGSDHIGVTASAASAPVGNATRYDPALAPTYCECDFLHWKAPVVPPRSHRICAIASCGGSGLARVRGGIKRV